jgi:hypothetical protein
MRWLIGPERDLVKGLGLMAHHRGLVSGHCTFAGTQMGGLFLVGKK